MSPSLNICIFILIFLHTMNLQPTTKPLDTQQTKPPHKRVLQLDYFRGLMLVIMMLNHLLYFPLNSLKDTLYPFTYESFGFVTAAEGFIFLSGLVLGIVYPKIIYQKGLKAFNTAVYKRAFYVYKFHMASFLFVVLLFCIPMYSANWPTSYPSQMIVKDTPMAALLKATFLLHQTHLLDILSLYVLFLLSVPYLTRLLERKKAWTYAIIVTCLWGIAQLRPQLFLESNSNLFLGWFEVLAWQSLFFIGYFIGFQFYLRGNFNIKHTKTWLFVSVLISMTCLYIHHFETIPEHLTYLFSVRNLGIVRIINFLSLTYLLYRLALSKPNWFKNDYFVQLGQNAIYVFVYHVALCYLLNPFQLNIKVLDGTWQLILFIILTISLYIPVVLRKKWQKINISPFNLKKKTH